MAHKEIQRQNTIDEIKGHARVQMESLGPAGISMSTIARAMEISAPALYRYFDNRDDLIRAILVDAIEDFESALKKSFYNQSDANYPQQFWAVTMEYREWAQSHPMDFGMIFNYPGVNNQPLQIDAQGGLRRVFLVFLQIIWGAYREGKLRPLPEDAKLLNEIKSWNLDLIEDQDGPVPEQVNYTALVAWSRIHGLVMLEIAQRFRSHGDAFKLIYHQEVVSFMKKVGLELDHAPTQPELQQKITSVERTKTRSSDGLHVIFGGGPLGIAVMSELVKRGKQVRMVRPSGQGTVPEGVELLVGDAFQAEFARKACQDAVVVYQCAQPTNSIWMEKFAALNAAILDGAAAKGAKFIYGDDLLVYGSVDGVINEGLVNKPQTRKGQVRAQVAEAVLTAHRSGRVRVVIGRASDNFGPYVVEGVLGRQVIIPLLKGKPVSVIGDPGVPHTFTYIEDFGKALVELGEREEAFGQIWLVPNPSTLTQNQVLDLFYREAGFPSRIQSTSRHILAFKGLYSSSAREKSEIMHQFEKPLIVDSSKFEKTFRMTATPLPEAVRRTVMWYREFLK